MSYGNQQFRQQALSAAGTPSPFASSIRQGIAQAYPQAPALGFRDFLQQRGMPNNFAQATQAPFGNVMRFGVAQQAPNQEQFEIPPEALDQLRRDSGVAQQAPIQAQRKSLGSAVDPSNTPQFNQSEFDTFMGGLDRGQQDMINMFANRQVQQLQQRLQQQMQQSQNPMMGMGLGGARPYGMEAYQKFGRPQMMQQPMPMQSGGYNQYSRVPMQQPSIMQQQPYQQGSQYQNFNMQQQYMNPYQQMRPQPQQYGGYNQYQQMGGYGNYGAMPNPYQPQQMGYNPNNYGNYAQNQLQGYGGMQAQSQGVY